VELNARNLAQVSINLTTSSQTPMTRVYEMVKREADATAPCRRQRNRWADSEKAIEMRQTFFLPAGRISPSRRYLKIGWQMR